ncbi:barstar family protein [Enterobacter sp. Bisph1]|uniref:barstar family protein n=1 Tax=Enterobacter sp. Bisph1 TaxID=1274399 RepID=UPI00057BE7BB|nr:barstar family protein [Enterobacter sp. Bisph1]
MGVEVIKIDGVQINSKADFHRIIGEKLDFGPYYGHNADALWDMLSSGMAGGMVIVWENSERSKQVMGDDFYIIIRVFEKTKQRYLGKSDDLAFDYVLN